MGCMDTGGTKKHLARTVSLPVLVLLSIGVVLGATALLYTRVEALRENLATLEKTVAGMHASSSERYLSYDAQLLQLADGLYAEQNRVTELVETVDDFEGDVSKLTGSVKTLQKITATDPQLLQKYSSIYFLNEHYIPADLEPIAEKYDYQNGKQVTVHAQMLPFLEDLLEDAWDDGVELLILSGYRSFAEQTTLKQDYTTRYGTGANAFSADQGYSEHQLGTTIDVTNAVAGENLSAFNGTAGLAWLRTNAYKYGFVMSYPEENIHYIYEPWHWRFVGKDLARYLQRNDTYLYALEQRKIDGYLASLFDK